LTVIKQRKIIADKHIYESPRQFKKFLKGKNPKTQRRYSAYRRRNRDLIERGFNQKYDKKTKSYVYTKKGISRDDLKKKPKPLSKTSHYVHGVFYLCQGSGVEFEHTHHFVSRKPYDDATALSKHASVFPQHEVISHEFLGSKIVED